ncbi:MAG: hypothetical protein M1832_000139 [Thelocarpon impressellum]|nr:MAG: hypothetical protein M1832_000139 [Thelocarpon impressellum]
MASREGPPDSAIIWALLELGAKPDEMQDEYDWTVLHIWAGKDARSIDYPSAHDLVIEKIVEKTADLNQMSNVGTPLHHLMASDASLEQVQRVVKRLVTHPSPASLEVQNRNQLNPLLFVIGSSKDPIQRAKVLLEFGARPDFTTTDGENIVSEAIGNAREAYWAFPRLIELLRSYDAARSSASISGTDPPALFDASTSYMLGFYPDEQPHKRHWEILYTYQDLGSDFRGRLVESLQSHYDDDRIWPRLVLLEMYPEILEVRGQGQRGKGWVEALLMDDTPVEARIAWGKVEEIRDLAGKVVDPSQR